MTSELDALDARLLALLAAEPRIGVLECSRRLGGRPRHRAGAAGQAVRARGDQRLRPGVDPPRSASA